MYSKTVIVGHLGRDPESRFTAGGQSVASFTVATNRRWTDQSGQTQEKTTWFRVTAWGKLGDLCSQYLAKGRLVLVEGDVEASAWKSQDGEARATLELTARNVRFLGGRDMVAPVPGRMQEDANGPAIDEEEIPF
jgi:single-strand DNA-binding protein